MTTCLSTTLKSMRSEKKELLTDNTYTHDSD